MDMENLVPMGMGVEMGIDMDMEMDMGMQTRTGMGYGCGLGHGYRMGRDGTRDSASSMSQGPLHGHGYGRTWV